MAVAQTIKIQFPNTATKGATMQNPALQPVMLNPARRRRAQCGTQKRVRNVGDLIVLGEGIGDSSGDSDWYFFDDSIEGDFAALGQRRNLVHWSAKRADEFETGLSDVFEYAKTEL